MDYSEWLSQPPQWLSCWPSRGQLVGRSSSALYGHKVHMHLCKQAWVTVWEAVMGGNMKAICSPLCLNINMALEGGVPTSIHGCPTDRGMENIACLKGQWERLQILLSALELRVRDNVDNEGGIWQHTHTESTSPQSQANWPAVSTSVSSGQDFHVINHQRRCVMSVEAHWGLCSDQSKYSYLQDALVCSFGSDPAAWLMQNRAHKR